VLALLYAGVISLTNKPVEVRRIVVDITAWYWHFMALLLDLYLCAFRVLLSKGEGKYSIEENETMSDVAVQHGIAGAYEPSLLAPIRKRLGCGCFCSRYSYLRSAAVCLQLRTNLDSRLATPFGKESITNATIMTACLLSSSLTWCWGCWQRGAVTAVDPQLDSGYMFFGAASSCCTAWNGPTLFTKA